MKNIHLLPTDKPSRLFIDTIENKLYYQPILHNKTVNVLTQHIYITSDEEIKEGDWWIDLLEKRIFWVTAEDIIVTKADGISHNEFKKIILTTDQDLIKDGVQSINDEFLEWFVKNPSCEQVEVEKVPYDGTKSIDKYWGGEYKIIIPKEEPKHETLEEAAEKYENKDQHKRSKLDFIEGAKWQQARMYSEEDLREAYFSAIKSTGEGRNGEYTGGNDPNIEEEFGVEFENWFKHKKK